ncbi:MAG: ZIP family metal transporter [Gammaproteobacteria bacterium]|nr:ZIP family metal transporter [Gammaproteobacteria bacterium]
MSLLNYIIIFTLLGGVLSVVLASLFLVLPSQWRKNAMPHMVSFATGALLGTAFLALLPHALTDSGVDPHEIFIAVLSGLLIFFLMEKLVIWRHCHSTHCDTHTDYEGGHTGSMVLIGDGLHNFVDGVLIAAAFLTDEHLGIVTAVAVAAHEIPQEIGDFSVLLHSGFSRGKALLFNVLASLTTVLGGLLAYYALSEVMSIIPYVLAVAASSFIYIAVADLIPGLHKETRMVATATQIFLIVSGVVIIYVAHSHLH